MIDSDKSHECEIYKDIYWSESITNKSVSPCFVYSEREKVLEMPKSRSHVFLSPPLEGVVHLCHRRCCFHLWTSTPVAIATVMGERVRSGSERPVFSFPPWSVLAPRPVTAAVSRRCEVWLSAGGGRLRGFDRREKWCWELFISSVLTPQWQCGFPFRFQASYVAFSVSSLSWVENR